MNSLVKSFPFAAILSLAMATTASAIQPDRAATSVKLTESQDLIAQTKPPSRLNQTRTRRFIDEMITLHMQMVEAAEEALQSQDPEIKSMAQETIKTSNAAINRMMEMRRKLYRYLDEGIGDDAR
jgi:uncharacterized protein (DUF305 family)